MRARILIDFVETVISYFCIGFTLMALLTHFGDGNADIRRSLIAAGAFTTVYVVRLLFQMVRDYRANRQEPIAD